MKILHLIDSGGLYGAEKMLLSLVQEQVRQGLQPMILSAGELSIGEKPIEKEARVKGLPVTPWRMNPGLNLRESRRILMWARKSGYDILHSHGFKFNVLLGTYPKPLRRIPMVATVHGYVHAKRFTKIWLYELLDRFSICLLQGVALVGEAMQKDLPTRLSASKKIKIIPNGLDINLIKLQASQPIERPIEEFIASHSPVLLGVGRLSHEKGFDRLVEAFQVVCGKFENPGLIIVGEGDQRVNLEARISDLKMRDKVLLPGYCFNVPGLQRRSDLVVMPSLTEGLPITLLEAMSVGVPILVSPVGDMPAVLGYGAGGYILPETCNAQNLGAHIVDALGGLQSVSKTDWSLKKVISAYSSETMERAYRELYNSVMAY